MDKISTYQAHIKAVIERYAQYTEPQRPEFKTQKIIDEEHKQYCVCFIDLED